MKGIGKNTFAQNTSLITFKPEKKVNE